MYRYVFKRVKDTIDFGVNVRKSFACHQTLNNKAQPNNKSDEEKALQQTNNSVLRYQEINFLIPQQKRVNYEDFKRRYNCKHPNSCNTFLQAITWSTALIAGFYASQLLCLYRRNHHFDPKKCFYTRYLQHKNKLLHRKFLCAKQAKVQTRSLIPTSLKFTCPLKKRFFEKKEEYTVKSQQTNNNNQNDNNKNHDDVLEKFSDEFARLNLFDKRYEKFFKADDDLTIGGHRKVFYNVNNNDDTLSKTKEEADNKESTSANNKVITEDEAIDKIMSDLSEMIGELEFQLGVECVLHGNYNEAIEHFRMSSSSNNASACFNLALLYEQGLGVQKDLNIAMKLYLMAAEQGHDKSMYNIGVYFARGLGGAKRSFKKAKQYFERAASYGNADAKEALLLLLPQNSKKKSSSISSVPDDFIVTDDEGGSNIVAEIVVNRPYSNNFQSIAVT